MEVIIMQYQITNAYPLKGIITYFEAYMQITTSHYLKRYRHIYGDNWLIVDNKAYHFPMQHLSIRKQVLALFNKLAKQQKKTNEVPPAEDFATNIIYLKPEQPNEMIINHMRQNIASLVHTLRIYCHQEHTVMLIASHLEEYDEDGYDIDQPHVHILFVKTSGSDDQLTEYLGQVL